MNRSEAGKLGAIESAKTWAKIKQANEFAYNNSPQYCKHCNTALSYDDFKRKKKFCNSSCSTTYNNLRKETKKKFFNCIHCNSISEYHRGNKNKYCSIQCQQDCQSLKKIKDKIASAKTMKKFLINTYGNKCWNCGIVEWDNKPLVMDLEHIDGNSNNNELNNLSLLCPNCHSQTSTYKAKNKGNGRHSRMKRYHEGKSY